MRLLGLDQGDGGRASFDVGRQVINFDMPKEIENYVHRIGRTGSLESFPYHLIIPQRLHIRTVPQAIVPLRGHSIISHQNFEGRDIHSLKNFTILPVPTPKTESCGLCGGGGLLSCGLQLGAVADTMTQTATVCTALSRDGSMTKWIPTAKEIADLQF